MIQMDVEILDHRACVYGAEEGMINTNTSSTKVSFEITTPN